MLSESEQQLIARVALAEADDSDLPVFRELVSRSPVAAAEFQELIRAQQQLIEATANRAGPVPWDAPVSADMLDRAERFMRETDDGKVIRLIPAPRAENAADPARGVRARALRWLAVAAAVTLAAIPVFIWVKNDGSAPDGGGPVAMAPQPLHPAGTTLHGAPTIVWENGPEEQRYDVWILPPDGGQDQVEPLYKTGTSVRSPVAFSQLVAVSSSVAEAAAGGLPDGDYRVLVCLAGHGKLAGTAVPFKVAHAGKTATVIAEAKRLREAGLLFDSRAVLLRLPDGEQQRPEVRELLELLPPR